MNSKVHSLERTRRCSGLRAVTVLQWWPKPYQVDGVAKLQPSGVRFDGFYSQPLSGFSCFNGYFWLSLFKRLNLFCVQKLGRLLADFVQTFRPAAKMVSIAGFFASV